MRTNQGFIICKILTNSFFWVRLQSKISVTQTVLKRYFQLLVAEYGK